MLLTEINQIATWRITATKDLSVGDCIAINPATVVGGTVDDITLNPDGSFDCASSVTSFQVAIYDPNTNTLGAWATQTII